MACVGCRQRCAIGARQCQSVAYATLLSGSDCTVSSDDFGLMYGVVLCCDQDGATALLLACQHGYLDVARWLVTVAGSDARAERDNVCIPGAIRVCVICSRCCDCSGTADVCTLCGVMISIMLLPFCWHLVTVSLMWRGGL